MTGSESRRNTVVVEPAIWRIWVLLIVSLPLIGMIAVVACAGSISVLAGDMVADAFRTKGLTGVVETLAGIVSIVSVTVLLAYSWIVLLRIARRRKEILTISPDGVRGRGYFKYKHFGWNEIERIYQLKSVIRIVRFSKRSPWLLGFDEDCIIVSPFFIKMRRSDLMNALHAAVIK